MKVHKFTQEERSLLLNHKHIAKVTDHTVSFTPAFKKFAVAENMDKGRRPQDIFITEGIAVSIIGDKIPGRNVEACRERGQEPFSPFPLIFIKLTKHYLQGKGSGAFFPFPPHIHKTHQTLFIIIPHIHAIACICGIRKLAILKK